MISSFDWVQDIVHDEQVLSRRSSLAGRQLATGRDDDAGWVCAGLYCCDMARGGAGGDRCPGVSSAFWGDSRPYCDSDLEL